MRVTHMQTPKRLLVFGCQRIHVGGTQTSYFLAETAYYGSKYAYNQLKCIVWAPVSIFIDGKFFSVLDAVLDDAT